MVKCPQGAKHAATQVLLAFATLVLAARSVIPAGYMLAQDPAGGGVQITICTGLYKGPEPTALPPEAIEFAAHYQHDAAPIPDEGQDCPFAVAVEKAPPAPGLAFLGSAAAATRTEFSFSFHAHSRFGTRPPLPARGPPTLL
jgi:hypothetical protein